MIEIITGHPITSSVCAIAGGKLLYDALKTRLKGDYQPKCPKCNKLMVTRISKKGKHKGCAFWGCVDYRKTGCDGFRTKGMFDKKTNRP